MQVSVVLAVLWPLVPISYLQGVAYAWYLWPMRPPPNQVSLVVVIRGPLCPTTNPTSRLCFAAVVNAMLIPLACVACAL